MTDPMPNMWKMTLALCTGIELLVFRYPKSEHYYAALIDEVFSDFLCQYIGIILDCFKLHAHSRPSMLKRSVSPTFSFDQG